MRDWTESCMPPGSPPLRADARSIFAIAVLAAVLTGPASRLAQAQQAAETKPAGTGKPADPNAGKQMGGYQVHQTVELGGRLVENKTGSEAMWATMVNQSSGPRLIGQSMEMRTLNPMKTPFFDTLTTNSVGYGGDPYDVTYLRFSKGRWYDFNGSFRRGRSYYDYNLMPNSLLSTATAATPVLVPEPDSLHIFNTVRRSTDTLVTLMPLSRVSYRAGFNLGTNEGPTLSTAHVGGDVQVSEWFRNALETFTGGVDVKLFRRTTLSYDQFLAYYKGDSFFHLAPTPFLLSDGTPVSLGVNVLTGPTVTCGSGGYKTQNVINGIANPFCSGTTAENMSGPARTSFPTEQLRFGSHYWDHVAMNGRVLYSGGLSTVNSFNQTFVGLARAGACPTSTACMLRSEIETGAGPGGQFAKNKRINVNADYGIEAELNKYVSVSDSFNFWNFRVPGYGNSNDTVITGPAANTSMSTPLNSSTLTAVTTQSIATNFLNQKIENNTLLGLFNMTPQVRLTGGWRFVNRNITDPGDDLAWHQNWLLLGGVVQPSRMFRLNVNYEMMNARSANSDTPSDTYTREAPNKIVHLRGRFTVAPARWVNFSVTGNDYHAQNNDPLVNHTENSTDFSFAAQVIASPALSLDFNYAHDDVFSVTDLCYVFTANANYPVPPGAANAGTCVQTADNPSGAANLYLGNGYYDAPATFFMGTVTYAPSRLFRMYGGARYNSLNGAAEMLNPLMVPGALQSKTTTPFADLTVNIAPQWAWHGNWEHHSYNEPGPAGPASRDFGGDVFTLTVKYAF